MQIVATPRAPVEIPSAPVTPSRLMLKKTLTTKALSGMPKRFIMTDRCESGTYLLRNVPMDGKYMPTHASKAKNPAMRAASDVEPADAASVEPPMAIVANINMPAVNDSVRTPILPTSCPNSVDPNRQHAMKQEKTVPYGVAAPVPKALATAALMAGGHCKTKMYMAASNKL